MIAPEFKNFQIINKGWGCEKIIDNQPEYCGKLMYFNKGKKMSFHSHDSKKETFYLLSGKVIFRYIDLTNADYKETILAPEDIVHIPRLLPHQIEALEDSIVIEFSTHDDVNDSFRYQKGDSQQ